MSSDEKRTGSSKLLTVDRIAFMLFVFSLLFGIFAYGFAAGYYRIFPFSIFEAAREAVNQIDEKAKLYPEVAHKQKDIIRLEEGAYPGVNFVTAIIEDDQLSAKIMDMEGNTIHEWLLDWFELWPVSTDHVHDTPLPESSPGTHVHGAVIMENGDLVFSFEELGLLRLNVAGEVVWRLHYQTHHSVFLREDGNLWVSGLKIREEADAALPNYVPPLRDYTVLEVSPAGEILQEISVFEVLRENNLQGLLYLGAGDKPHTRMEGDTLHLNDVECFPASLESDFFAPGDIMISLRNINAVVVFQEETHKVKYVCTGMFVRQHDPDFLDGRTISVYDNNNVGTQAQGVQSRIVKIDAVTDELTVAFEGTEEHPFFTRIMGKNQWLPNGNLLVTESMQGRALEITPTGEVVWEYINYVDATHVGILTEVTRLPASVAELYDSSSPEETTSASN